MNTLLPTLDRGFAPMISIYRDFQARVARSGGGKELLLCAYRRRSCVRFAMRVFSEPCAENCFVAERIVKLLLWSAGGFRLYVAGDEAVYAHLAAAYRPGGARAFDAELMEKIYEHPFEVVFCEMSEVPELRQVKRPTGGFWQGCRIGFDAGGSDRKVVAVQDGKVVFSETVDWTPKSAADADYLRTGIDAAIASAARHLPRVDSIGVSSAGICVDNKLMESSLYRGVPAPARDRLQTVYLDVAQKYGVPLSVENDGDVTALAGGLQSGLTGVLGISMGTSEAAGYLGTDGQLSGWLSELSSVPIDAGPFAAQDGWTGDVGCGSQYLSQNGVLRLAAAADLHVSSRTLAGGLREVQALLEAGDERARTVFTDLGIYLGYALAFYALLYDIRHVLVLGRVMSGHGGDYILDAAERVLRQFPECRFSLHAPDEEGKRLGQACAAASLPQNRENA